MFFALIISLIGFWKYNQKLIDRDLHEIIKQDATYFNPKTMKKTNELKVNEMKECSEIKLNEMKEGKEDKTKNNKVTEESNENEKKNEKEKETNAVEVINEVFEPTEVNINGMI